MLYHKEIGLPTSVNAFQGKSYVFRFGRHAIDACHTDRYGIIKPPVRLTLNIKDVIEVETNPYGIPVKFVVRQPYDQLNDIIIVFIPDGDEAFVKTFWLNRKDDTHATLNKAMYQKP